MTFRPVHTAESRCTWTFSFDKGVEHRKHRDTDVPMSTMYGEETFLSCYGNYSRPLWLYYTSYVAIASLQENNTPPDAGYCMCSYNCVCTPIVYKFESLSPSMYICEWGIA